MAAKNFDPRVKIFGDQVRAFRTAAEWSQEELAHRAGVHWTYVSGIERGVRNPSLGVSWQLADALGVPLGQLLGETPPI